MSNKSKNLIEPLKSLKAGNLNLKAQHLISKLFVMSFRALALSEVSNMAKSIK